MKTFMIEGDNILDIESFYEELNRVFMQGEDWKLGPSLDALDDMLYGGYGALNGEEEVQIIWNNAAKSKEVLGLETTKCYFEKKLERPDTFNAALIEGQLNALLEGSGPTYYEIVKEIMESHAQIRLVEK